MIIGIMIHIYFTNCSILLPYLRFFIIVYADRPSVNGHSGCWKHTASLSAPWISSFSGSLSPSNRKSNSHHPICFVSLKVGVPDILRAKGDMDSNQQCPQCCGCDEQIHTDCRSPVEKKGWHGHSLTERATDPCQDRLLLLCSSRHQRRFSFIMLRFALGDYLL